MKRYWLGFVAVLFGWAASASAQQTIELTGNDSMQFSKTAFEVPAGEEITLVFRNTGNLPKAAMGHNVVVLKQGGDVATVGNAAVTAPQNDYIPAEGPAAEMILSHTKLLGPGEEDTITFTLPEAGEYPFLCSFPGHWALMKGTITAK